MQNNPTTAAGDQFKDKLQHSYESGKESAASCCSTLCHETSQLCESASDGIRKNPIAAVVGAAFVGAAICYLILENRHQPTFGDRYLSEPLSNAKDSVNDSLGSIFNTLKFW